MLGRSSQRLVVLLLLGSLILVAGGCGGGGDTPTTTSGGLLPPFPGGGPGTPNELIGTQLRLTPDTPAPFANVYQTQPLVVLFYVSGGRDDTAVLQALQNLEPSFGAYTFFYYDYSDTDEYGDLSTLLAVDYSPTVVLIDRTGTVYWIWSGYVDEGSLNQSLVNLGRE